MKSEQLALTPLPSWPLCLVALLVFAKPSLFPWRMLLARPSPCCFRWLSVQYLLRSEAFSSSRSWLFSVTASMASGCLPLMSLRPSSWIWNSCVFLLLRKSFRLAFAGKASFSAFSFLLRLPLPLPSMLLPPKLHHPNSSPPPPSLPPTLLLRCLDHLLRLLLLAALPLPPPNLPCLCCLLAHPPRLRQRWQKRQEEVPRPPRLLSFV
mmetsp:Transcript_12743/g.27949  ORF Transcript_12743/g.27949 Transcript_12743/m.27949 type:complete len:208 (-) Transcript_12743:394-1017(-)